MLSRKKARFRGPLSQIFFLDSGSKKRIPKQGFSCINAG
jgi:hypothetical protein